MCLSVAFLNICLIVELVFLLHSYTIFMNILCLLFVISFQARFCRGLR